ncbi:MAG: response regulator transcription factor [Clostridia bacterium]|nr:response regulator transcription factor [Clostridia bacterium]
MSKLIYVNSDDPRITDVIIRALHSEGFQLEYGDLSDAVNAPIHTDIALVLSEDVQRQKLSFGGVTIDRNTMTVYDDQHRLIHFTPIELSMLALLMEQPNRAVSRAELLKRVWGIDYNPVTRVSDDTAKRLRQKLKDTPIMLETIWGYGFRITERPQ